MNDTVFFSICIPAYKRINFLKRLMDSIAEQTFTDFEVIVTDDSPNAHVAELCDSYSRKFQLRYFKNQPALGTPENWNEAIRHAKGEWIKLMHDDDWFANDTSLEEFAEVVREHPGEKFFFSAYRNVFENTGKTQEVFVSILARGRTQRNPSILIGRNIIGPPSVTVHKNDQEFWYDKSLKWVVDIDFYIRYMEKHKAIYIPDVLVNVGMHAQQVTAASFRKADVEIPENFYLLNKLKPSSLKNMLVYDAWWRLMRNLHVVQVTQIHAAGYSGEIPKAIQSMIKWQSKIPSAVLRLGIISKFFMMLNYIRNLSRMD